MIKTSERNNITIIMYHYIRDLRHTRFPEIKGLDLSLFIEQLDYLEKHYNIIRMEDLIYSIDNNEKLKEKSVLLTFDDAYIDHYNNVFPILNERGLQGSFFPPAKAIQEKKPLYANKIHFILAAVKNVNETINTIFKELDKYRVIYKLESNEHYFKKLAVATRFDPKEIVFIKRLLQKDLNETLRNKITDTLFKKYLNIDEEVFHNELYMDINQIKCMYRNGMYIGSHGYNHYWLGNLSKEMHIPGQKCHPVRLKSATQSG